MPPFDTYTMAAFVDRVHRFAARNFDNAEVLPFLQQARIEPASLECYLHWKPGKYARNLVHKDATFELLFLCWDQGQVAPIHGHEGEKCWARVERGRLRFTNYRERSRAGGRALLDLVGQPVDAGPGHVDGPADIHSVENPAAFGERAVSLHLYSRPYAECEIFDPRTGEVSRVRLAYDSIDGKLC